MYIRQHHLYLNNVQFISFYRNLDNNSAQYQGAVEPVSVLCDSNKFSDRSMKVKLGNYERQTDQQTSQLTDDGQTGS